MITLFDFRVIRPQVIEFYAVDANGDRVLKECILTDYLDDSNPDDLKRFDDIWNKYRDREFAGYNVFLNVTGGKVEQFFFYDRDEKMSDDCQEGKE